MCMRECEWECVLTRIFSALSEKTDSQGGLLPSSQSGSSNCKIDDSERQMFTTQSLLNVRISDRCMYVKGFVLFQTDGKLITSPILSNKWFSKLHSYLRVKCL